MRRTVLLVGSRAPWSAALVWAILATFFFTLTACGSDDEDDFPLSPDVVDGWTDEDSGDGDTTPTPDGDTSPITYEELCDECARREMDCPTRARFLSKSLVDDINDVADELCEPFHVVDPCEDFYDVADYVWVCEGADVGGAGGTFEVRPSQDGSVCEVWWAWEQLHTSSWSPDNLVQDTYIAKDRRSDAYWIYHGPGSMSTHYGPDHPLLPCTGTLKE